VAGANDRLTRIRKCARQHFAGRVA
jgi:hypothetical protein